MHKRFHAVRAQYNFRQSLLFIVPGVEKSKRTTGYRYVSPTKLKEVSTMDIAGDNTPDVYIKTYPTG